MVIGSSLALHIVQSYQCPSMAQRPCSALSRFDKVTKRLPVKDIYSHTATWCVQIVHECMQLQSMYYVFWITPLMPLGAVFANLVTIVTSKIHSYDNVCMYQQTRCMHVHMYVCIHTFIPLQILQLQYFVKDLFHHSQYCLVHAVEVWVQNTSLMIVGHPF